MAQKPANPLAQNRRIWRIHSDRDARWGPGNFSWGVPQVCTFGDTGTVESASNPFLNGIGRHVPHPRLAELTDRLGRLQDEFREATLGFVAGYAPLRESTQWPTGGLTRLRETAVQLARAGALEVIALFGQMGGRKLAAGVRV